MLQKGDKAPDFSAANQNGDTVSLAQYAGKKLIVFFYPKDSSPGCTAEACNL
ncbi:MAG: redoxin domain-containing protein, partial [Bacteroidales bacterium]|nr:redoxin domain-containing protein [Bacteroidales bacterium]